MTITLTIITSSEEIVSGIPKYVEIVSNVPSTIYYTLDGTTPSINSPIYLEPIEMPYLTDSLVLKSFAIDGFGNESDLIEQLFISNRSELDRFRSNNTGKIVNRANFGEDRPTGYDADSSPARFVDLNPEELDIIKTDAGINGTEPGTDTEIGFPEPGEMIKHDNFIPYSTTEKAEFFNPEARLIIIDNRKNNEVKTVLRTYYPVSNIYNEFYGKRIRDAAEDANYVSGGFVRRFYDPKENIMVSYYFDHNECKYIKNIQTIPENIKGGYYGMHAQQPLVFKWIYKGRQSSI